MTSSTRKQLVDVLIQACQRRQLAGGKSIKRTELYAIAEYVFGIEAIRSGLALTVELLTEVASNVGGLYERSEGKRARITL
jgi:hypothetical protein